MSNPKYIHELHNDHITWKKNLAFAADEIRSFENRLSEVLTANTKTDITAKAEHYQNAFIRHNEVIDADEKRISAEAEANNVATDHRRTEDNATLRERMEAFDKIFAELKAEFNGYLGDVL
jgi:hemerythrin-like domain-containing protein